MSSQREASVVSGSVLAVKFVFFAELLPIPRGIARARLSQLRSALSCRNGSAQCAAGIILQHCGPCTNDVRTEGEGGVNLILKGGCVDLVLTRGGEGVQNPRNLADVICACPLVGLTREGNSTRAVSG